MPTTRILLVTSVVLVFALTWPGRQSLANEQEYVSEAGVQQLYQGPIPQVDGKEIIIREFTLPPGHVGQNHVHLGPVFVYVVEGEFSVHSGGTTKTYKSGELYPEPFNAVMQVKNLSPYKDVKVIAIQIGEVGKPMMMVVE